MDTELKELLAHLGRLLENSIVVVLPFFVCLAIIQLLIRLAPRLNLLDLPSDRKRHEGATPLVGGLAIFGAVTLSMALLSFTLANLVLITLASALVALGLLDDRLDLSAWLRLFAQGAVTLAMIVVSGVHIESLGNLFGTGQIDLGPVIGTFATIVFAVGVINAINMIDGVDGLAGSLLLISFLSLAMVAVGSSEFNISKALFICSGTLGAFLCFNARVFVRRAEVFMGDAGSMMLGFMLLWFLALLTQEPVEALSPIAAGWVFGVPLLDTTVVIARRLRERRSPMSAGRDHLHHLLLDAGTSVNLTVGILALLHAVMVLIGLWLNGHRQFEPVLFFGFVALVVLDFTLRDRVVGWVAARTR